MMPATACILLGGHKVFHREEVYGKYISFLPMTETVEGLTLRGFNTAPEADDRAGDESLH